MDWFSIAKIGASLLGAKAAGDAAKASSNASQTDLKKLRDEAQAAGFNPLTVLRATGGQGFNKGANGKLASATFWGNFANAVPGMVDQFDPDVKRRKELDLQQAQASLDNTMASTQLMKIQTVAPMAAEQVGPGGYGGEQPTRVNLRLQSIPDPKTPAMPKEIDVPIVPSGGIVPRQNYEQYMPFLGSLSMSSAPIQSTAAVEEGYGDAASWVYGPLIKFPADVYTTGILQGEAAARSSGSKYGFNNPARAKGLSASQLVQDVMRLIDQAKTGQLSRQNFELMAK